MRSNLYDTPKATLHATGDPNYFSGAGTYACYSVNENMILLTTADSPSAQVWSTSTENDYIIGWVKRFSATIPGSNHHTALLPFEFSSNWAMIAGTSNGGLVLYDPYQRKVLTTFSNSFTCGKVLSIAVSDTASSTIVDYYTFHDSGCILLYKARTAAVALSTTGVIPNIRYALYKYGQQTLLIISGEASGGATEAPFRISAGIH